MWRIAAFALVAGVLSACTPFVPVQQDYSKNERLQVKLDSHFSLRTLLRDQLRQTNDPTQKAELTARIKDLNIEMVRTKVAMGYPSGPPDPVEAVEITATDDKQQENGYPTNSPIEASTYGTVVDHQGINESNAGATGGAFLGSALGGAAYIDRSFNPGNNYSAVTHLGVGLLGAFLGSQLDRPASAQYHIRYALRQRNGEIVYSDSVQKDAFRHPVGMCLRMSDLQPASQSLCTP